MKTMNRMVSSHSVSIYPKSRDISRAQKRMFFVDSFGCQNNKLSFAIDFSM
jgi:hypothetical protein